MQDQPASNASQSDGGVIQQIQTLLTDSEQARTFLINTAVAIGIFIVGWIASKWIHSVVGSVLRRRQIDEALTRFVASLAQYAVLAMAVIAALDRAGVPSTSFVAILGSAGLAIGLAMQGNLGHFASGVMLLLFRPFTLGDIITVAGQTGLVEEIGLFATTLSTPFNETIFIPNGEITSSVITNLTKTGYRRCKIEIGVAYGADIGQVCKVLKGAAESCDLVLKDPEPGVAFIGFGASSLDFVVLTSATKSDFLPMQHQVRHAIYDALNSNNIEIPFDQIVIHQAQAA